MITHGSHHLVYGTLNDYLTGEELTDTDDERIRQELSRMMVEEKQYHRDELLPRLSIDTFFARCYVRSVIDLTVCLENRQIMIIRYGPGSLVSRERAAIAAARVLNPASVIPLAVVTNGREAELLETSTGKILEYGLHSIPDRSTALAMTATMPILPPPEGKKREQEMRILNAFDLERCCI
ncbi:type I restriction enzyme HsdR N-terminal domain-containing protein [Desulfoprunum benzoelyticum]|uniref:Type I restriction enzyme R protein N-terminal domain-containing protein n=1 Tax=Desulfoprunum benzoelyticum TaxID=1506996 RepID=A0A840UYW5_9BACT|nr:type I restriction enzyme HsdR N-terminal domain-containing protein [Desulfoprunum benzoelyticum]MBB5348644.1 hypothetical protein [Desulfoprunum benzoelyticum]MBM9529897.1 type I restriction enzyme HsdR N-terminal domain-containing protein [Desulfoprunum benzoelyticum]